MDIMLKLSNLLGKSFLRQCCFKAGHAPQLRAYGSVEVLEAQLSQYVECLEPVKTFVTVVF